VPFTFTSNSMKTSCIITDRALIITRDEETIIKKDNGLTIEVKPIWKWLLE